MNRLRHQQADAELASCAVLGLQDLQEPGDGVGLAAAQAAFVHAHLGGEHTLRRGDVQLGCGHHVMVLVQGVVQRQEQDVLKPFQRQAGEPV